MSFKEEEMLTASEDEMGDSSEDEMQPDSGLEDSDSDAELQLAFQKGLLKPGLVKTDIKYERKYQNNIPGLKQSLAQLKLNLPWIERLDVITDEAPLAPEMAIELEHYKTLSKRPLNSGKKSQKKDEEDLVKNDFTREMSFYRQAQAAVLEAIPRLHHLGVPTRRPQDYFAQMAKTDDHMNKVKRRLLAKQKGMELSEQAKKIREIKKLGKKTQISVQLEKQKEKREMLENIKKYKKGQLNSLDFLEDKKKSKKEQKQMKLKQKGKDKKYGHGGRKKNIKRNTSQSFSELPKKKSKTGSNRPGKARRKQMKNKRN